MASLFPKREQEVNSTKVLSPLADPQRDSAGTLLNYPVINCWRLDWRKELQALLFNGIAVDLVNFDYELHAKSCELLALASRIEFSLSRDPESRTAHFRKRTKRHERDTKTR